jgi:hypothetical protein
MTARRVSIMGAIVIALASIGGGAAAQGGVNAAARFADLEPGGNRVEALRATIHFGFPFSTARAALVDLAAAAHLDLTFDASIPGLTTPVSIAPHDRTIAAALIEVADSSRLRVRVGPAGELIVVARPPDQFRRIAANDTTKPVQLPGLRTAVPRFERDEFELRPTVGEISITQRDLRSTPVFVEPDVLRSAQSLPGIGARSDYTAGFNVRGGEADQNLVLLDGYPIYSPFHAGGLFSTFIDPTVSRVDLRTGSLPVQYGGRLSGVIDVRSVEHSSGGLTGAAHVSLLSSLASVGDSFDGGRGSWDVGARRTYVDVISRLLGNGSLPYHFQDAQAHASWRLEGGVTVSATAYGGSDVIDTATHNDALGRWGNGMLGATIAKHVDRPTLRGRSLGDSATLEQRFSTTTFDTRLNESPSSGSAGVATIPSNFFHLANFADDRRLAGSVSVFNGASTHLIGYELSRQRFSYSANTAFGLSGLVPFDSISQRQYAAALYADELWRVRPSLLLDFGARADAFDGRSPIFSPRLAAKFWLDSNTALTAATAAYAQAEHSLGREEEPIEPIQFWVGTDRSLPVSRARDFTLGVERWLNPSRILHVETFRKQYSDLLLPDETSDPAVRGDEFSVVGGSLYGAEFLLRQFERDGFSGWLSYAYTVSTRTPSDGIAYSPAQDRRHNLNAVGSWHNGNYVLSLRVNVASGLPYTPVVGEFVPERFDPVIGRYVANPQQAIVAAFNSSRLPMYQRIDLSATHEGRVGDTPVAWYLSVVNALNAHNVAAYGYEYSNSHPNRWSFPNLPLLPTFGVRIGY